MMTTVEQNELQQATVEDEVLTTAKTPVNYSTDPPVTTAAQPMHDCTPPCSGPARGRASRVKSAYCNELPIRQFVRDSKSSTTTSVKSRARTTTARRESRTTATKPAAVFSDAGISSCLRPCSHRATPQAGGKTSGRNGTVASGTCSQGAGGQCAVSRQRSPWRPADVKPVRRSSTEVNPTRKRCPSVSPEVQRRSIDSVRSASTSRVRRTRSVPATSSAPPCCCRNNIKDLPPTPPTREPSIRDRGRSPAAKTLSVPRSESRLPLPLVPANSTRQTTSSDDHKPTLSNVPALVEAAESPSNKPSQVRYSITRARFLVLAALFSIVVAVIGGYVNTYMNTTPASSASQ